MASSGVEIASSSSNPFGCVLRDRNRGGSGNGTAAVAFEKNLKELVRDHINACCVSVSPNNYNNNNNNDKDENAQYKINHRSRNNLRMIGGGGNDYDSSKQDDILKYWPAKEAKQVEEEKEVDCKKSSNGDESNLGASSLVQIWEARLLRNHPSKRHAATTTFTRSHSFNIRKKNKHNIPDINVARATITSNDKPSSARAIPTMDVNIPPNNLNARDDSSCCSSFSSSSVDWESASLANSRTSSESEKLSVSDIIKRLTCDGKNDIGEQCSGNGGGDSPRIIRGRQALHDMLLQKLEKERHREIEFLNQRNVVSKFPQKGRIQAMLRLRSMQRCIAIQAKSTRPLNPTEANRPHKGSNVTHIRARFNTAIEQAAKSAPSDPTTPTTTETENSCIQLGLPSTGNQLSESSNGHQQIYTIEETSAPSTIDEQNASKKLEGRSLLQKSEACEEEQEETNVAPDVTWQGTSLDVKNLYSQETSQTSPPLIGWDENETEEEEEEEVVELQDFEEVIDDWFSSIARPRSYWEDKRKAWYEEFLGSAPENNEIRKLLERRTVSTFLSSEFREGIEQLMASHTQIQSIQRDEEMDVDSQERMGQLMLSYFQSHSHSCNNQEAQDVLQPQQHEHQEEESEEEKLEEDEQHEESPNSCQFIEATDYPDQRDHSPSPLRSWNQSDNQVSERVSAPLPFHPRQPESSLRLSHPSIEMELIYDMRGQMQQLHYEISELRRSIQRCTEMQVQLLGVHSVRRDEKNTVNKTQNKRICCICYETHVDSFLYRCGHMCTCLKCAHELQWSSGKCPICRAPILDVVRAYLDS